MTLSFLSSSGASLHFLLLLLFSEPPPWILLCSFSLSLPVSPSLVSCGHACLPPWLTNNPKDVTPNSVCSPRERHRFAGRLRPHRWLAHRNELESRNRKNEWLLRQKTKSNTFTLTTFVYLAWCLCIQKLRAYCCSLHVCITVSLLAIMLRVSQMSSYEWMRGHLFFPELNTLKCSHCVVQTQNVSLVKVLINDPADSPHYFWRARQTNSWSARKSWILLISIGEEGNSF